MLLKKSYVDIALDPQMSKVILALARNSVRTLLSAVGEVDALEDETTGTVQDSLAAVDVQLTKGVLSGNNLVQRAEFYLAIVEVGNALSVLAEHLNDNGFSVLGLEVMGEGDGDIEESGVLAAIDTSMTAAAGSGNSAMLRTEMNAAIIRARNNLAKVAKAYNRLAVAIGVPELVDHSKGSAGTTLNLENIVTPDTVVSTGDLGTTDLALLSYANAALVALADNIATISYGINEHLFNESSTLVGAESTVVVTY